MAVEHKARLRREQLKEGSFSVVTSSDSDDEDEDSFAREQVDGAKSASGLTLENNYGVYTLNKLLP